MMRAWLTLLQAWRWPVAAMLISVMMLAAAHGFERFMLLYPCPLCLRQREIYWALLAMTAVGLALWRLKPIPRFLEGLNILIGMVFVCGAGIAFYHMGVENGWFPAPAGCAVPTAQDAAEAATGDLGLGKRMATSSCSEVPWSMIGLSMAGWNMVVSLILAGLSFYASRRTRMENLRRAQAELGEGL